MLSLTRRTEYALIAVCHLARESDPERVVSTRDIADSHSVPLPLLMNVLKQLNREGYVTSVRGARGGYKLAQRAADISLANLVEAVEGPVKFVRCVSDEHEEGRCCDLSGNCSIREPVRKVHAQLQRFLSEISIADVAFDADYADARPGNKKGKVTAR